MAELHVLILDWHYQGLARSIVRWLALKHGNSVAPVRLKLLMGLTKLFLSLLRLGYGLHLTCSGA